MKREILTLQTQLVLFIVFQIILEFEIRRLQDVFVIKL